MEKEKHKIDVVVKYFYPVTAGIEINILETYSRLAKSGWDVTIHTSKDTYLEKNCLPSYEVIRGLKIKRYSFRIWGFWPKINWKTTNLVCLHNFDIFPHFQILIYILVKKLLSKKNFVSIVTPHGGFSLDGIWSIFPVWQRLIKRTYHKLLAPYLINNSVDGIRVVSQWEKNDLLKRGIKEDKIELISNGIEDEAYINVDKYASKSIRKKVQSWGKYIIQIGRVYPVKNYETTIKALENVHPEIKLVIVGPVEKNNHPGYWKKLEDLITRRKLNDRIIFAGVIRGVDKYFTLKHAQIMVHMSLWESFCNAVHEAMSQGLPVIVANNTALTFLVKEGVNGYLVNTLDDKELAERINYLLTNLDSPQVLRMRRINRRSALESSWGSVAERLGVFYSRMLNKYSRGTLLNLVNFTLKSNEN